MNLNSETIGWQLIACAITGLLLWLFICNAVRFAAKLLLSYKGWMYGSRERGSKVSITTRLWAITAKLLLSWNKPRLFSFQGLFPRLPVPSVHDTLTRYLDTVRPLLDDDRYNQMKELVTDFETTIASRLQRFLIVKSWWSSNYVTDWWEEYVYLRSRSALMINSNYYGVDVLSPPKTNCQSARAALIVHMVLRFRRWIDREELEPIMFQKIVPLCSWQYERMFNTVRIPGIETDRLIHYKDSNHIVVMHKGRYYKVIIHHKGRILNPAEIQM